MGKEMTFEETKEFCVQIIELYRPMMTYTAACHIMLVIYGADLSPTEQLTLIKKLREDPVKIDQKAVEYLDRQILLVVGRIASAARNTDKDLS